MDYTVKAELFYSRDHEWVLVEGENARVGISGYAAHHLGDIVFVELPEVDSEVAALSNVGVIESVKAVADMHTPLSGRIIEVNEELETSPELLNQDAYQNYIFAINLSDASELDKLMDAAAYEEYCRQLD